MEGESPANCGCDGAPIGIWGGWPLAAEAVHGTRELVGWLAAQIHQGVWAPEARMPPERRLAERLGLNRSTVAAAYDELQALGLVDRRQGSGTYVHGDLWGISPDWTRYLESAAFRPTAPLVQRFREARLRRGIIDFTQADLGPTLWPKASLATSLPPLDAEMVLGYAPPEGLPMLREAVAAELARSHGLFAQPDTVLITAGAQQALYLIVRTLLRPGDAVALERPSFYYSLAMFQSSGVRLLPVPMDDEGLLPDALEDVIRRHRPAMVWLNPTYHNPTSTTLGVERRRAVLAICHRWNLPLVEDDAYGDLTPEGADAPPPPLKAMDDGHRVLYVGSLSKTVAPGLRIGWVVAPRPIVDRLADVRGQIDLGTPGYVQAWAAAFLRSAAWPEHLDRVRRVLAKRRLHLAQAAAPLAEGGFRLAVPQGGMFAWGRWSQDLPDRARLDRAIEVGVVYVPGRVHGAADGYARLNYLGESPQRVAEGLAKLAAL